MLVTFIFEGRYETLTLPDEISGCYDRLIRSRRQRFLMRIEAKDGGWLISALQPERLFVDTSVTLSPSSLFLIGKDGIRSSFDQPIPLHVNKLYRFETASSDAGLTIFTEDLSINRLAFRKYYVPLQSEIMVGRNPACTITYQSAYISSRHCRIHRTDSGWSIQDLDSLNGVYVNQNQIGKQIHLKPGDLIYILGLRLIIGYDFICVNDPLRSVQVNLQEIRDTASLTTVPKAQTYEQKSGYLQPFFRSPRFLKLPVPLELKIEQPPAEQKKDDASKLMVIGPSITMALASVATTSFTVANAINSGNVSQAAPSILMALVMIAGSLMWPLVASSQREKKRQTYEKKRSDVYYDYLEKCQDQVLGALRDQTANRHATFPTLEYCASAIHKLSRELWERTLDHPDALQLRIGQGTLPMIGSVQCNIPAIDMDEEHLHLRAQELFARDFFLDQVPITLSLIEDRFTGVIGPQSAADKLLQNLLLQISFFYSPDDIQLALIGLTPRVDRFRYFALSASLHHRTSEACLFASTTDSAAAVQFVGA